jgi:hypothetical protein
MEFPDIMPARQNDNPYLPKNFPWVSTDFKQRHYEMEQQIRDISDALPLHLRKSTESTSSWLQKCMCQLLGFISKSDTEQWCVSFRMAQEL